MGGGGLKAQLLYVLGYFLHAKTHTNMWEGGQQGASIYIPRWLMGDGWWLRFGVGKGTVVLWSWLTRWLLLQPLLLLLLSVSWVLAVWWYG